MKKDTVKVIASCVVIAAIIVAIIVYRPHADIVTIYSWYKEHLTYATIILLMTIESSFIPFPSEIVVPPAAYFAAKSGDLNIFMIILTATIGAILGAVINYVLSLIVGRPIIYGFANSRIGHMCLIDADKVERAEKYFDKHGAISTFLGRLIPAVRQLISIPAGLAKMNFGTFLLFTTLGAGLWNSVLAYLGYALSKVVPEDQLFQEVEHYNKYLTWAGYALLIFIILFIVYQGLKKKQNKNVKPS
jgi:membrane protein DedA with SNARE-associated domain